jgi:poly(3-hydroxybutyrate) depolymerase
MNKVKKILTSLLLCFSFWYGFAENPIRKTIEFGGYEREYLLYIPENSQSEYNGLVVGLHGYNSSMETFFRDIDLPGIADPLNYALIAPQALPEKSQDVINTAEMLKTLAGQEFSLNSVWGCGLKVTASIAHIPLLNAELNKTIDDAGFIDTLIDNVLSEYKINTKNLFLIGTSMGGYMTYQYTLLHGNRLAGMISIVGTMGTAIKGRDNPVQIPICDFHSLTDEVVPYSGTSILSGFSVTLGEDKNEVID